MEDIALLLSFIINIILAIALFFKGAINQVVAEWIKSKMNEKKNRIDNLKEVHTLVKKLNITAKSTLVCLASSKNSNEYNAMLKESSGKWKEITDEIEAKELSMPEKARKKYRDITNTVKKYGSIISRNGTNKEDMLEIMNDIDEQNSKLLEEIEKDL